MSYSPGDKIIDSRDIIKRIAELEGERTDLEEAVEEAVKELAELETPSDDAVVSTRELDDDDEALEDAQAQLTSAKEALADWLDEYDNEKEQYGELYHLRTLADEASQYSGDWLHGETLILDEYWEEYVQELLIDIGDLPRDLPSYLVIDWTATADNLAADYHTTVDFDGHTYYMRNS